MQTKIEQLSPASAVTSSQVPTIDENITTMAPGQLRVIKRNGSVVGYDDSKIIIAITKAYLAVEGGNAAASTRVHETVARLAEDIGNTFRRRMPSGGSIHIEEMFVIIKVFIYVIFFVIFFQEDHRIFLLSNLKISFIFMESQNKRTSSKSFRRCESITMN